MSIFSYIGYTLTELFRKPDNWRQNYKQTISTFYTSNDVSKTCLEEKLLGCHNKDISLKICWGWQLCEMAVKFLCNKTVLKNIQYSQENTCVGVSF